jgi:hypothetical protein
MVDLDPANASFGDAIEELPLFPWHIGKEKVEDALPTKVEKMAAPNVEGRSIDHDRSAETAGLCFLLEQNE